MSEQLAQMQEILKKSLLKINQLESELKKAISEKSSNEPIAIVGLGCRFPGGVRSLESLWQMLMEKRDAVVPIPTDRWDNDAIYDPDPLRPGKTHATSAAFLEEDVKAFDADFFGIVPREAKSIDPLQRMILEVVYEALEEAGIATDSLKGTNTAVFIAIGNSDYIQARFRSGNLETMDVYDATGIPFATAAGRVSYLYDLHGTNFALDAACASSVLGLHLASESLRKGESDTAIVASANLLLTPELFVGLSKLGSLSASGKCMAFDENADGYVRGEGCGVAVLRRKADALQQNDNIHALILGSAVKHDGLSNGFTAPNPKAQLDTIQAAIKQAGIGVDDISFVEAHGIGNRFTDAMEIQAIGKGYKGRKNTLYVGSLKPNIGHLEACIGMAMLFKIIGTLQHKTIAPNIYFDTPNADVPWESLQVKVPTEAVQLSNSSQPLRVAINLSGYSGTNVHMIFEEAPAKEVVANLQETRPQLYVWSAKSAAALKAMAEKYIDEANLWTSKSAASVAQTLQLGRNHWEHRMAVIASSNAEVVEALKTVAAPEGKQLLSFNDTERSLGKDIAFLFTGQGAQYAGMCKEYYDAEPVFKQAFDSCNEVLQPLLGKSLTDIVFNTEEVGLIDQTANTQPALFAVEYALAQLWISRGIKPAAVAGHSVGEFVALVIAEAISLKDALQLIAIRGKLMQSLPSDAGAMAAVLAGEETVQFYIKPQEGKVSIAAINTPNTITISGEKDAVASVVEALKADKIKAIPLVVSHAFHSHLMDPILATFQLAASKVSFGAPQIPVMSNVTGRELELADLTPEYFAQHLRGTVRFADNLHSLYQDLDIRIFLECGPQATLSSFGSKTIEDDAVLWLSSAKKNSSDTTNSLQSLQSLFLAGIKIDWLGLHSNLQARVELPRYPWQRKVYWENPVRGIEAATLTPKANESVLGVPGENIATRAPKATKDSIMAIMQLEGADTLGLHPGERLDPDKSLREQGFDSMMSGEFLSRLEKHLNAKLEMSLLHTHGTMNELQRYFIDEFLGGGEVDEAAAAVTMNDIVFGNDMGGSVKIDNWHEIKDSDPAWLKLFKKIDQKISL